MSHLSRLFCLALGALVVACASPPPPPPTGPMFVGVATPPAGLSRLYVFRPRFSAELSSERPTLLIDGQAVSVLVSAQYSSYVLPPGNHQVTLIPQKYESSVWQSGSSVALEADRVYFLAIWNNTDASSGFNLVPGGKKLPFLLMPTTNTRTTGIQYELVPQEDALPTLTQMHEVPSSAHTSGVDL